MGGMDERETVDFWWLAKHPKRERREVVRLRKRFEELNRVAGKTPTLVPLALAAELLHVTKAHVHFLIRQGQLGVVKFQGRYMAMLKSIRLYARERPRHGRPKHSRFQKAWTKKEEALLGKKSDRAVAELLGRSCFRVRKRRLQLGIGAFQKWEPSCPWTAEEDKLLGMMPDGEVAKRLGRSNVTVASRRRKLGIVWWRGWRPWTEEEKKLLGSASDRVIAARLARAEGDVAFRRKALGVPEWHAG